MLLTDGYQTLFSFDLNPVVKFAEIEVTPPALNAGGQVDTTTMRNSRWRTFNPKALVTAGEASATVAYDSAIYTDALNMLGVNQLITITFPDGHTIAFWGWLDSFVPGSNKEGNRPTASIKIVPSNQDNTGAEVAPVYT